MKVTICVGSTCHLLGSKSVVETFKRLVEEHHLEDRVSLSGTFCMGRCQQGVCVSVEEEFFSVSPDTVDEFFETRVLPNV